MSMHLLDSTLALHTQDECFQCQMNIQITSRQTATRGKVIEELRTRSEKSEEVVQGELIWVGFMGVVAEVGVGEDGSGLWLG